jgi:hypothetical protein
MIRELDSRLSAEGDEIRLVWNDETDSVELRIAPAAGAEVLLRISKERAADAFRHPYAYLPR